jgi:ACR3 family arsenite efflux pump ArsB
MVLPPLLRISYWINFTPAPFSPLILRGLLLFFCAFFLAGILVRLVAMRHGWEKITRRLLHRIASAFTVLGLAGLLLYVFETQRIYLLSARAFYVLWVVIFLVYAWWIIKYIWIDVPAMNRKKEEREKIEKWLPKKGQ